MVLFCNIHINYYLSHVLRVYFIFEIEDGQCANGTTVLLPPHVACGLRERVKLEYHIVTVLSSYSRKYYSL